MTKFYPGEKLRCISNIDHDVHSLEIGKIYIMDHYEDPRYSWFYIKDDIHNDVYNEINFVSFNKEFSDKLEKLLEE